jgi:methylmalonyl-CoA/ethylmalonyl-CoA epimerase
MFKGLDHIVISVPDMATGLERYGAIFGRGPDRTGEAPGMMTAHFDFDEGIVELVQPTNEDGPVGKQVGRTGGGMYLLAMKVDDIQSTLAELRAKEVRLIGDPGEGNEVEGQVFVHPGSTGGVLLQLVEDT